MSDLSVDWSALANKLGTITEAEGGWDEDGGTRVACDGLTVILGEGVIASAVSHYLAHRPGHALAHSILRLLRPQAATDMCLEIFRTADNPDLAANAIELLRAVADRRVLASIPEILASPNHLARVWGIGILDHLYMSSDIEPDEGRGFVAPMLQDDDQTVRAQAQQLLDLWARDEAIDRGEEVN